MYRTVLLIFCVICPVIADAQNRDFATAERIANEFLNTQCVKKSRNLRCINTSIDVPGVLSSDSCAPFYLFSDTTKRNFVIVSGDERMKEILAYGELPSCHLGDMPIALKELLKSYSRQFEHLQNYKGEIYDAEFDFKFPEVAPFIKSTWEQGEPYNNLCPDNSLSGCVATAMSQVMNYYEYPMKGNGRFSYISATNSYSCSFDFGNTTFDWENVKNHYSSKFSDSKDSRDAIANLTYACGVSVAMDYDQEGSGAYMVDVPYALINFFNYNKNITIKMRDYHSAEEWYAVLCNELLAKRPVIYGGVDSNYGGHAFIIDGCLTNGKFHLNWGWGGSYDGYYELEALDPSMYKFRTGQDMVINVTAEEVGYPEDVFYATSFKSSDIVPGKVSTFAISEVYNYSNSSSYVVKSAKFRGKIGIGLFDEEFNFLHSLDEDSIDALNSFYGYDKMTFEVEIDRTLLKDSVKYRVAPYAIRENANSPTRIRTLRAETDYVEFCFIEDSIAGGTEEDDDENGKIQLWSEDFEQGILPDRWLQLAEHGNANWDVRTVILPSNSIPSAAKGRSYAFLNYLRSIPTFYDNRTVTKLITPHLRLDPDSLYILDFNVRKIAEDISADDILNVYYNIDDEWVLLKSFSIVNEQDWVRLSVDVTGRGVIRFAFEGSIVKGSSLLLDNILLYVSENNSTNVVPIREKDNDVIAIYNLAGIRLPLKTFINGGWQNLPKGGYIVRYRNLTSKIIYIND